MPSVELFRLVYISRAVELFSIEDLSTLLVRARAFNESCAITGLLLYKDLSFLQVLEGDQPAIEALFKSICQDSRHFRIKVLIDCEAIAERSFAEWSMGFMHLDEQQDALPIGFTDFLDAQWDLPITDDNQSQHQLNTLLNYFRCHS